MERNGSLEQKNVLTDTILSARRMVFVRRRALKEFIGYAMQTYGLTALGLLAAIALVRMVSAEAYGMYGAAMAWAGVLGMFAHGGSVPLLVPRLLSHRPTPDERSLWLAYVRSVPPIFFTLALAGALVLSVFHSPVFGAYVIMALCAMQGYNLLQILPLPEARDRRMGPYLWVDSFAQMSRVLIPVATVAVVGSITGYFIGLLVAPLIVVIGLCFFPYWRKRIIAYFCGTKSATAPWSNRAAVALEGIGAMFETGAATLYASVSLLTSSSFLGWADVAQLKILIGFSAVAMLCFAPYLKWISLHLPRYLRQSAHPFRIFIKYSVIGGLIGCLIYGVFLALAPILIPFVYGASYVGVIPLVLGGGLMLIWSGFSVCLSIISKMYGLIWPYALVSIVNLAIGVGFALSPIGPRTLVGMSWFYGLWLLPPIVVCYAMAYHRLRSLRHMEILVG